MILPDINLLIHAYNSESPVHDRSRAWWEEILFSLLDRLGTAGDLTTDAHLAALAIEHQAELHSTDADFVRFPGLSWRNPLD